MTMVTLYLPISIRSYSSHFLLILLIARLIIFIVILIMIIVIITTTSIIIRRLDGAFRTVGLPPLTSSWLAQGFPPPYERLLGN